MQGVQMILGQGKRITRTYGDQLTLIVHGSTATLDVPQSRVQRRLCLAECPTQVPRAWLGIAPHTGTTSGMVIPEISESS